MKTLDQLYKKITTEIKGKDPDNIEDILSIVKDCINKFGTYLYDSSDKEWIDPLIIEEFRKHRKQIKKPMTPFAEKRLILSLEKAKDDGHDPMQILEKSIVSGWQGIVIPDKPANIVARPPRMRGTTLNPDYQISEATKLWNKENNNVKRINDTSTS